MSRSIHSFLLCDRHNTLQIKKSFKCPPSTVLKFSKDAIINQPPRHSTDSNILHPVVVIILILIQNSIVVYCTITDCIDPPIRGLCTIQTNN